MVELYVINKFLSEKKYDLCKKYFDKYNFENNMKGYASLYFRYGMETNNNIIINYYINNINKLKQTDLLQYCLNTDDIEFFKNNLINNKKLNISSLDKLIDNNKYNFLSLLDGYYISSTYNVCNKNEYELKKYDFYDVDNIIDFYKNKISLYNELLKKINNIDCVVDGGNILHSNKGKLNYNNLIKMDKIIKNKFNNPLYIFNIRHKKKLPKNFVNNIFITPANEYDDIYILLTTILTNCYIITNDNFRDHIYMIKDIDNSFITEKIKDNIINYNNKNLGKINKYSNCIQIIDSKIYIPCKENKFLIINSSG